MRSALHKSRKNAGRPEERQLVERLGNRCIVLVGMMGCGKTSVGRRLARRLELRFVDADDEIVAAAGGQRIRDIFLERGEPYFRAGEARVIARLLTEGPCILSPGGGAYMNAQTRAAIAHHGISVWLKAGLPVLLDRVLRRSPEDRPMLNRDGLSPEENMKRMLVEREPVYALADMTVETRDVSHEAVVDDLVAALLGSPLLGAPLAG